ncbi:MAG TPA: hypothetical protein VGH19_13020 [Verrucomicrobiae bacterium]
MNPFVNLHQRGTDLPPGCKDLIDVIKPKVPRMETERLRGPDVEYLKAPFHRFYSTGDDRVISILIYGSHCFLSLNCIPAPATLGFGLLPQYVAFNDTVRDFFQAKGIPALSEKLGTRPPGEIILVRYPLPPTAFEASELISQLLTQVYQETGPIQLMLLPFPKRPAQVPPAPSTSED